jgi:hypothetical protein
VAIFSETGVKRAGTGDTLARASVPPGRLRLNNPTIGDGNPDALPDYKGTAIRTVCATHKFRRPALARVDYET